MKLPEGDSIVKVASAVFRDLCIAIIGGLVAVAYFILREGDMSTYYYLLTFFFVILVVCEIIRNYLKKDTK